MLIHTGVREILMNAIEAGIVLNPITVVLNTVLHAIHVLLNMAVVLDVVVILMSPHVLGPHMLVAANVARVIAAHAVARVHAAHAMTATHVASAHMSTATAMSTTAVSQ